jgi:hypothetical protein
LAPLTDAYDELKPLFETAAWFVVAEAHWLELFVALLDAETLASPPSWLSCVALLLSVVELAVAPPEFSCEPLTLDVFDADEAPDPADDDASPLLSEFASFVAVPPELFVVLSSTSSDPPWWSLSPKLSMAL